MQDILCYYDLFCKRDSRPAVHLGHNGEIIQARENTLLQVSTKTYAQVLVGLEAKALDKRTFTYRIPEEFQEEIQIGVPVIVPFGHMPQVTGFVVGFSTTVTENYAIKEISEVLEDTPLFDLAYLQFLDWVSDYYATPLTQVISCALPSNLIQKIKKEVSLTDSVISPLERLSLNQDSQRILNFLTAHPKRYTPKYLASQVKLSQKAFHKALSKLKKQGYLQVETVSGQKKAPKTVKTVHLLHVSPDQNFSKRQQAIIEFLQKQDRPVLLKTLLEETQTTLPTVRKLQEAGVLLIGETPVHRDPLADYAAMAQKKAFDLSAEQAQAVETIRAYEPGIPFLLYGVTGSGKTEVYLALAEQALLEGKSVLVMVPEIALTSHIARRFIERFDLEHIALWHSNLSEGERVDTWRRVAAGELRIVIGARSGIFAPLQNLGLIIADEEHDGSFKQDSPAPRYNAKLLAKELAQRTQSYLVFGSATPEVSFFYEANRTDRLLSLPQRFGGRPMAKVELVDMKQERSQGSYGALSRRLKEELEINLQRQEQAIILINRRGFYTLMTCVDCDTMFMCPQCTVALTVHRSRHLVRCHYCGYEEPIPQFCPQCASMELTQTGTGTQRVEEELLQAMPTARILRLDSDVMQRKHAYREIFEAFSGGDADILVGTQMVAKGLDIPNVTLVGVVSADSSFALPDYRSSERGFQLLTQVAGRAGRGDKAGRVVIQSLDPNHAVIQYAKAQDYEGFYQYEMLSRKELAFPPFSQLFRFVVSCPDEFKAQHFTKAAALNLIATLEKAGLSEGVTLLGPAACVIARIQGRYRFHFLLKNQQGPAAHQAITHFYKGVTPPEEINFILDIDPQSLL